jgi:hypothetical protein
MRTNTLLFVILPILALTVQFFIARAIAKLAVRKGQSYPLFFWLSFLVSWFVMLIVALVLPEKSADSTNQQHSDAI